ncbi:hypothetical protein M2324_003868 [Rhodovulum sulfidophilum]|uniref:hypothetical protein n=1 Tax=Rhodovulum sulfidophilum TaxID=35806 RepID=UPI0007B548B3|nr:hypothetical protein [Rhodovulum sulfidophilum]ANB33459.1 hypothetical protein A6W98_04860 [Rhodovulum sulfidophilum DSM 1374]ANB37280.1 hypothetical protein A6024_04710 [Rhodovulum sulfidophilum]MCW2305443.1 hypothetical protein [Rhodovulum sulfidophilum]
MTLTMTVSTRSARRRFAARGHDVWSCDLLPAEDRWKIRSRTFEGAAQACADQWGGQEMKEAA